MAKRNKKRPTHKNHSTLAPKNVGSKKSSRELREEAISHFSSSNTSGSKIQTNIKYRKQKSADIGSFILKRYIPILALIVAVIIISFVVINGNKKSIDEPIESGITRNTSDAVNADADLSTEITSNESISAGIETKLVNNGIIFGEDSLPIKRIYSGDKLTIVHDSAKKYSVITENGTEGYIYGNNNANGFSYDYSSVNLFDSCYDSLSIEDKLDVLKILFPEGKYWNHIDTDIHGLDQDSSCLIVTDSPCDHDENGYVFCNEYDGLTMDCFEYDTNIQCLGFASMISDFLFGKKSEIEVSYDFSKLKPGDHIRIVYYEHSMIVLETYDDYVTVVECNSDYENCEINWGRKITEDELYYEYGNGIEYLSRG